MSKLNYPQKKVIVVLGPTASGKSALAVTLAKKFNGEIISADSRQIYRGMNFGTGKITKKEMAGVPHHLLNVASPRRRFTVAQYKNLAQKAIKKIQCLKKLPIICGGTGFYIRVITQDLQIPTDKPNLKLRSRLEKKTTDELFALLKKLDRHRAKDIDQFNRRRLIRAIEIVKTTGRPIPKLKIGQPYDVFYIGIERSPDKLKKLIARRLKMRLSRGMIQEVAGLKKSGLSWKRLDDFGLEYRWVARFLQKKVSREEMLSRLQKEIEHFAKRQMTWFKKYEPKTAWVSNKKEAQKLTSNFLLNRC